MSQFTQPLNVDLIGENPPARRSRTPTSAGSELGGCPPVCPEPSEILVLLGLLGKLKGRQANL